MPEPFNFSSGDFAGQSQRDVCLDACGTGKTGEKVDKEERGVDNPFNVSNAEGSYFQVIPRLNQLRDQVRTQVGFSACDLIRMLDKLACQANFDPVGSLYDGKTADAFFQGHPEFNKLELELARKICPANVSEVLTLVKESGYYTPTRRIVVVIETVYRKMLSGGKRDF